MLTVHGTESKVDVFFDCGIFIVIATDASMMTFRNDNPIYQRVTASLNTKPPGVDAYLSSGRRTRESQINVINAAYD